MSISAIQKDCSGQKMDPPLLTKAINYYKFDSSLSFSGFLTFVGNRQEEFNGYHWGAFAKKVSIASSKKWISEDARAKIRKITLNIFNAKVPLTAGQSAQVVGSLLQFFSLKGEPENSAARMLDEHLAKNLPDFTPNERAIALKGVLNHPESSEIVRILFQELQEKELDPSYLTFFLLAASELSLNFNIFEVQQLINAGIEGLDLKQLVNLGEGIRKYSEKKEGFPLVSISNFLRETLGKLQESSNLEINKKAALIGAQLLAIYRLDYPQWTAFCLEKKDHFPLWDQIGLFRWLNQVPTPSERIKELLPKIIEKYLKDTPDYRLNKYPEDGHELLQLARSMNLDKELIDRLESFTPPLDRQQRSSRNVGGIEDDSRAVHK